MQKGANEFRENAQHGVEDAGNTLGEVQNETQKDMQNAGENIEKGVSEFGENARQGVEDAKGNVEKGVGDAERALEEPLRKLAEVVDGLVNAALPGAPPKAGSPYEHVPGQTPYVYQFLHAFPASSALVDLAFSHESILLSAALLGLKDGSIVRGLCQQTDGTWAPSQIDLSAHYGNNQGNFVSGDSGFKDAGRNFTLEPSESSVMLKGELNDEGNWIGAEVDVSICVVVKDGGFAFAKQ